MMRGCGRICVDVETLESNRHEISVIKSGIKLYEEGNAEPHETELGCGFSVKDKHGTYNGYVIFTEDGRDIDGFCCGCSAGRRRLICNHVVAGLFAIQGGIIDRR